MTSLLDKLNLRPAERRFVVIAAIIAFVVLNFWFVWPHFNDWAKIKAESQKSQDTLKQFRAEIAKSGEYEAKKAKLEDEGSQLLPEEAAVQLRRVIDSQAMQSGVVPNGINDQQSRAAKDQIFEERAVNMGFVNTGERELVDFLFSISAERSMIRVRDLTVRPDPQLQKLQGSMTLVASYQKKGTAKSTTASATAKPAAKPATTATTNKPAAKPVETKPAPKPAGKTPEKPATKTESKPAVPSRPSKSPPPAKPLPNAAQVEP